VTAFRLPRENTTVRKVPNYCKYETGKWRRERVDEAYATLALKSERSGGGRQRPRGRQEAAGEGEVRGTSRA
jgi:hypothetical protein